MIGITGGNSVCQYLKHMNSVNPWHPHGLYDIFATDSVSLGSAKNWGDLVLGTALISTSHYWYILMALKIQYICSMRFKKKTKNSDILLPRFYRNDKYKCYTEIPSSFWEFSNHFMCLCNRHKVILKGKYQYWHFSKRPKDRIKTYAKLWLKVWVADILVIWGLNNSWPQFSKSL